MKYVFIVNSIAGKGKYKKIVPNIERVCKEKEYRKLYRRFLYCKQKDSNRA